MGSNVELLAGEFTRRSLTLATAESLTGGRLGATITGVPGASVFYLGGVVSYATAMKTRLLGVPEQLIADHTVISGEVAEAMAAGIRERTGADWAAATTGVAGPDPQDGHAPGEVWVCVVGPAAGSVAGYTRVARYQFSGDRAAVREQTVAAAVEMLLQGVLRG